MAYVECGNAAEAYRRVYSAGHMTAAAIEVEASRLRNNPKVALRIGDLQRGHAERHVINVDKLTEMAVAAYDTAMAVKAPSAAVSAIMALGKLHGLIVDKRENRNLAPRSLDDLSNEELLAIVATAGGEAP